MRQTRGRLLDGQVPLRRALEGCTESLAELVPTLSLLSPLRNPLFVFASGVAVGVQLGFAAGVAMFDIMVCGATDTLDFSNIAKQLCALNNIHMSATTLACAR